MLVSELDIYRIIYYEMFGLPDMHVGYQASPDGYLDFGVISTLVGIMYYNTNSSNVFLFPFTKPGLI